MPKRPRRTIGNSPLDAMIPQAPPEPPTPPEGAQALRKVPKERLTIHLPVDLIDRVKNAVFWTPGMTLAALGEEALQAMVDRLEADRGGPFPPRREELRGGRPLK
jgi:hypothetical protein